MAEHNQFTAAAESVDLAFLESYLQKNLRPIIEAFLTEHPELGGWSPRIEGAFQRLLTQVSLAQFGPVNEVFSELGKDIEIDAERQLGAVLERLVRS